VARTSDRALRDLLDLCRQERISVAFLVMPESREFQSWYSLLGDVQFHAYLRHLAAEYAVPVLNARNWMADDDFLDGHHLLPDAAAAFSERLGRQALQPFLASVWACP
jgi:hypothetical protein